MFKAIAVYAFQYGAVAFVVVVVLFNLLYFFVVLPKLSENEVKVSGDVFFGFRQYRYVRAYLGQLSKHERRRWHNIFIRYSFAMTFIIWLVCMASIVFFPPQ